MKNYTERTESIKEKVAVKRKRRAAWITATATLCVVAVLTAVCSLPIIGEDIPNINAYKDDVYYPLIEKLNGSLYGYGNDKVSIFQQFGNMFQSGEASPLPDGSYVTGAAPSSPTDSDASGAGDNSYEETTLNQVDGVTEADLLKRSSKHVFYLKQVNDAPNHLGLALDIYELGNNTAEKINEYKISEKDGATFYGNSSFLDGEIYLSEDASVVTVIVSCVIANSRVLYTAVISLDVSDPLNVAEINRSYVSGAYLSSRKVDGKLLVVTNFNVASHRIYDYSDRSYYVPRCGTLTDEGYLPLSDIYLPEQTTNNVFTVLALFEERSLETVSQYALLSYSQNVYVSQEHIFVTRTEYQRDISKTYCYSETEADSEQRIDAETYNSYMTDIVVLSYKEALDKTGCVRLEGTINDRFSMDEKDGILRAVTTVSRGISRIWYADGTLKYVQSVTNASLYCVDITTFETVAAVELFAENGEEVKSARFDGDYAYVCTAVAIPTPCSSSI
ncbi:MAG: beta-propeller domain-containing protein [Firmicutes bacterium]|nr:beta-propeller domain-containing protein [Bacillota bacterium]